tara:strand:- start:1500 stop:2351 length:852 start_codon:yes stop_codon:yes gene_type:complete
MSGRKYIGTIVFDKNIDQYSKSKKDSLKREIYEKMTSNEYFIKNISVGGGQFLSHKNKTIKLKGNKAFVEFKETISPHNDTYKKRNKDKYMFNWAQKNFKRSMNFNKKMFLDESLKAVKISVKKDNKTKKKTRKTRKRKKTMNGGVEPILMGVGGLTALGAAGAYKIYKNKKEKKAANDQLLGVSDIGFTVGGDNLVYPSNPSNLVNPGNTKKSAPDFVNLSPGKGFTEQIKDLNEKYPGVEYNFYSDKVAPGIYRVDKVVNYPDTQKNHPVTSPHDISWLNE